LFALDLFFGGLGVGTFISAVMLNFFYGEKMKKVSRIAAYLTPICVALGFLFLILHLGRPERAYRIFVHFNVTSPLSWGGWLQTIFFTISVIYALMWFAQTEQGGKLPSWLGNPEKRKVLGFIGVPFALAVGVYHGFFLMVFKSRPLWSTGPVTLMAICGFVTTGIALLVLILSLVPAYKKLLTELKVSRNILGVAIIIQLFIIALWISSLYFGPGDSHEAMVKLITEYALGFWGGAILLGLILPLLMGISALFKEKRTAKFSYAIPLLTSLMVLIGGFILRYLIIIVAQ